MARKRRWRTVARRGMIGSVHDLGNGNLRVLSENTKKTSKLGAAGVGKYEHFGNVHLNSNHSGAHIRGTARHWSPKSLQQVSQVDKR